ncbi:MAG TPA: efflux RND transporter permease subunit [Vicinamibacterales bacterium]|nr:efflux RND transporter permease subunit [Vicinamibacterales bacterium]
MQSRRGRKRLLADRAVPARRVEDAQRAVATADARLKAAEARLTQRDETLHSGGGTASGNAFAIRAPIAGRIADVLATLGASDDEGAALFKIVRIDRLELRAHVPAADAAGTRDLTDVAFEMPGRADPVPLRAEHPHDAGVIDPKTGALPVQFEIQNPGGDLLVGQTGTAVLYKRDRMRTPTVPKAAVLLEAGRPYVLVQIGGERFARRYVAHPEQLRANRISLTELLDAVRGASENTSAGVYTEGPQEYVLQAVGRVRNPEEIGESVVALRGGRSVLIRDVADVREGGAFKRGEGSRSGKPAVIVGVQKQPGANTIELTARLDRELDRLQRELPKGMTIDRKIFRQADFIEVAIDNVVKALRDGGILVIVVVLLFLANLRAAAITLTAMPLSLAAAILVLRGFGATINTMTLGGMAIAIGALVDDAIIDVGECRAAPP